MRLYLPRFVVFEGIDGSGKTTLSNMLYDHFLSIDVPVVKKQEPTDGRWGKKIRELLQSGSPASAEELMRLFLLDREDDAERNIIPSLNSGKMIVMDRYCYSNVAYQGAMGIPPDSILQENKKRGFPEPDRVYLIDIDPEEAMRRIANRNSDGSSDIFEKRLFLERVREIYLSIADDRFLIIDGLKKPDEILSIIQTDIKNL